MSAKLLDGPAGGKTTGSLRRCPHFLRIVIDVETGAIDALDQQDDVVRPGEAVHVYVIVPGTWSVMFVRPGGRYEFGEYRHLPGVQAPSERMDWVRWCEEKGNEAALAAGLSPWTPEERV